MKQWTKEDDQIVLDNIFWETWRISELIPGRTLTAIKTRKKYLREIGLAVHPRGGRLMQHLHNQAEGGVDQDLKDKVEALKTSGGTFKDIPRVASSLVGGIVGRVAPDTPASPILGSELDRLKNRVSYLEGYADGMEYVLEITKSAKEVIK